MAFTKIACSIIITLMFSYVTLAEETNEIRPNLVENSYPILRGALVDQYTGHALIIRLKSPEELIADTISKIEFSKMSQSVSTGLKLILGNLEMHYQKQFVEILSLHQELIATPYPLESTEGNGRLIDVSKYGRTKRNIWVRLLTFLRSVRPVARNAGKLTRYGKFMKGVKYAGYAASGAIFAYEMAEVFGVIPDQKYEEVSRQLAELHKSRTTDLMIMKNITLFTTGLHDTIKDVTSQLNLAISESYDKYEIYTKASQILNSYMQQINMDLLLLRLGGIPSNVITIENQRLWLESKLPYLLLADISTITPHLRVTLKAIDETRNQIVLYVEIPVADTEFQLLNYVRWEPELVIGDKCYSSPKRELYFAFKRNVEAGVIRYPLLIDPESCLTSGFILCESDAILQVIPNLTENPICTQRKRNSKKYRQKRSSPDLFEMAHHPTYDLSSLVTNTLTKENKVQETGQSLEALSIKISELIKESKEQESNSKILLEQAARDDKVIKVLFAFGVLVLIVSLTLLCKYIKNAITTRRTSKNARRTEKLLNHLKELESGNQH